MNAKTQEEERTNIGRLARISLQKYQGEHLVGNVIDLVAGTNNPKRIRIQRGNPKLQGQVVMPGEYCFLGWADEEED